LTSLPEAYLTARFLEFLATRREAEIILTDLTQNDAERNVVVVKVANLLPKLEVDMNIRIDEVSRIWIDAHTNA
jgi:hypothetical protein